MEIEGGARTRTGLQRLVLRLELVCLPLDLAYPLQQSYHAAQSGQRAFPTTAGSPHTRPRGEGDSSPLRPSCLLMISLQDTRLLISSKR